MKNSLHAIALLTLLITTASLSAQTFVKADATGANNGTSWTNAYTDLQSALLAPSPNDIWVAADTYLPTSTANRNISFVIPSGRKVYGGFAGTETNLNQRDVAANETILSGNIGSPTDSTDNSYNVVFFLNSELGTLLDGFTITGGYANDSGEFKTSAGGGILVMGRDTTASIGNLRYCEPTISNCIVTQNFARLGGGVCNGSLRFSLLRAKFYKTTIISNTAEAGAGMATKGGASGYNNVRLDSCIVAENQGFGFNSPGAIYYTGFLGAEDSLSLFDCQILNNAADFGAALTSDVGQSSELLLRAERCFFAGNSAIGGAAAISQNFPASSLGISESQTHLIDCQFTGNRSGSGAAVISSNLKLTDTTSSIYAESIVNCTFSGNDANALRYIAPGPVPTASSQLSNTVMWNNRGVIFGADLVNQQRTNSLVEGEASTANGNLNGTLISSHPRFTHALDYDLAPTIEGTYSIKGDSPLINRGDNSARVFGNSFDLAGNPRINGSKVDIGAYEDAPCTADPIVHVNINNPTPGDGGSWAEAVHDLQTAIELTNNSCGSEIWVAQGTYLPTVAYDFDGLNGAEDREKTFRITQDVAIYGGFDGTEMQRSDRDVAVNLTVLSGDLDATPMDSTMNAFHIVHIDATIANGKISSACLLDGFRLELANADLGFNANSNGGAIYVDGLKNECSPTIASCHFEDNNCTRRGGGIYCIGVDGGSSPAVTHSTFVSNSAEQGGAIFSLQNNLTIANCEFNSNSTSFLGGAIYSENNAGISFTTIDSCSFVGNYASSSGGAIGTVGSDAETLITDCQFTSNVSGSSGGAISNNGRGSSCSPTILRCRFTLNESSNGGAIFNDGSNSGMSNPQIRSCTFTNNMASTSGGAIQNKGDEGESSPEIFYCTFSENQSISEGGAIHNLGNSIGESSPDIASCAFIRNQSDARGGAIASRASSGEAIPFISNCSFFGNKAATGTSGGAIFNRGTSPASSIHSINNSIFWDNQDEIKNDDAAVVLNFSTIQDMNSMDMMVTLPPLVTGSDNLDQYPLLVDTAAASTDLRLMTGSPAIEAGSNALIHSAADLQAHARVLGPIVDMGAYEHGDPCNQQNQFFDPNHFSSGEVFSFETDQTIFATNSILTGADIIYDGDGGVLLDPGFEVQGGAVFLAKTEGCD